MRKFEEKKKKGVYGRGKNCLAKNSSKRNNFNPVLSTSSFTQQSQNYTDVTDDKKALLSSGINITRTNDEVELPKAVENNPSILQKKQDDEVTFSLSKPGRKQKLVYMMFYLRVPLFFLHQFLR